MFSFLKKLKKVFSRKLVLREKTSSESAGPVIPPRSSSLPVPVVSELSVRGAVQRFAPEKPLFLRCQSYMFTVLKEIAKGGFGQVHLAIFNDGEGSANKVTALKIMNDRRSWEREVEVLRALPTHRNIVEYIASGDPGITSDDVFYIAMRYYAGGSLSDVLRKGPLGLSQSLYWLNQIACAVGWMHGQGWAHLDVKPCNVLLASDGLESRLVLADLGTAFRFSELQAAGTLPYMAPEVLRKFTWKMGDGVVPASDWFSVGMTLIFMLCKRTALRIAGGPEKLFEILDKKLCDAVDILVNGSSIAARLPKDVEGVLRGLCATDSGDRPSADDVTIALDRLMAQYPRGVPNEFDNSDEVPGVESPDISFVSAMVDLESDGQETFQTADSTESDFVTAVSTASEPSVDLNTFVTAVTGNADKVKPIVNKVQEFDMMEVIPVIKRPGRLRRAAKTIRRTAGKVKKLVRRP